ncbi:phosphate ABC transporter substrate-binding protein (PhoT family) [Frigoribacterium sp. PhB160]|uniref:phosphate ABC transporter substrate-binding protein PstS n=1 Tax=Frigoribacterium sp. PhB160 TaxID=2485192 RepID=UPI000FBC123C|nr:phosphate ABC transporter substrate-binding protein PstS [Frigoribacterium sp. PhB160]ROS59165.1 phosphate ABC transporter substrate-binding protein (PhoT family) [Frigoribacterium sp. PhB160]
MNFKRTGSIFAIAAVGTMLLASCASNEGGSGTASEGSSDLSGTIAGIGASSQQSAQEAWTAGYQTINEGVTVNYDPQGSGGGRESFISGAADFAASDRAFTTDEISSSTFAGCTPDTGIVELPAYISPIAVVFNLDGVDELNLSPAVLAGIFSGSITSWDAPEIKADNPDADLPSTAITAVHRSDDSGTTENFTDYLNKTAPDVWTAEADGVWPFESGEGANQTSGMIDAVTNGTGTIGYADASRAGDLGVAKVKVGDEFVGYSADAAAAIVDESPEEEGRTDGDIAIALDRTSDADGVYPIVLVSYLIACESYEDATQGELVKSYLSYVTSEEGQKVAADAAGSAPISSSLSEQVASAIELIK